MPFPLLLRLHRSSTFDDVIYLAQQLDVLEPVLAKFLSVLDAGDDPLFPVDCQTSGRIAPHSSLEPEHHAGQDRADEVVCERYISHPVI